MAWVLIPRFHPRTDVGFEGLDAAVVTALEEVGGDVGEEPFDWSGGLSTDSDIRVISRGE